MNLGRDVQRTHLKVLTHKKTSSLTGEINQVVSSSVAVPPLKRTSNRRVLEVMSRALRTRHSLPEHSFIGSE